MKIFYKPIDAPAAEKLLENGNAEEVFLHVEAVQEIVRCLKASAEFLPSSGRRFQSWDVGLLERFEEG